ncbi:hypothetical protein [Nocardia arthritidis]|uniref:Uncharacterized protein n=1 Tax=Nocardia arthritidis TaxID=228602 RepID=A0A6G9YTQ5_9NOCA|nr:hypothetical protein [Nocardia arthritidis]QIS16584.1 hypothetical protein F5544_43905 [Nocardia arthritidis]
MVSDLGRAFGPALGFLSPFAPMIGSSLGGALGTQLGQGVLALGPNGTNGVSQLQAAGIDAPGLLKGTLQSGISGSQLGQSVMSMGSQGNSVKPGGPDIAGWATQTVGQGVKYLQNIAKELVHSVFGL